jgi:hypothetical protein
MASLPARLQKVGAIEADFAQDFAGVEPLVGGEKNQVAFLDFEFFGQGGFFGVVEEFDDGRFPFALFHFDVGQALGAEALGVFGHGLDLALGGAGQALGVERLDHAAGGDRAAENLEGAGAKFLGEIGQLHSEARVRLVDAVTVERLLEGKARERRRERRCPAPFSKRA